MVNCLKEIYNPVYGYSIIISKGDSVEKIINKANYKLGVRFTQDSNASGSVFCIPEISNHIIWFDKKKPEPDLVAHEAFHSVFHVLNRKGLALTLASEEAFAYLLSWTVLQINKIK